MRKVALAYGVTAALLARGAAGQTQLGPERGDLNRLRGDVWSAWTAPAHFDRGNVAPIGIAAAVILTVAPHDSAIRVWMVKHPNTLVMKLIGPLREGEALPLDFLGSGQYVLPLSAVAYTAGRLSHSAGLRDAGLGCAAAHLSSAGIRDVIYLTVSRVRPSESSSAMRISFPGSRTWVNHSFLSGHVANSMACTSFLGHRYDVGLGAAAMYAYSSGIGLGRMAGGWHWASDTIAGGLLGFAIGKFLAGRQLERADAAQASTSPTALGRLGASWRIEF